ncbi:RSM10 [Sanghuangporus vaninii]
MLVRRAKSSLLTCERLLNQSLRLRLPFLRGFATEAPPTPAQPSSSANEPTERILMVTPEMTEREYASRVVPGRAVLAPLRHEKTHGIPVAIIHVRGYQHRDLDLFLHFASHAASSLAIPVSEIIRLPTQRSLWTVPKGPFVHKKAQENFERRVHKRMIKAWDANDSVVDRWIHYIRSHPQPGIGMRIVRWQRAPVGIGRKHAERTSTTMLESQRLENITDRQRVEEVARNIVKQEMEAANLEEVAPKAIKAESETKETDSPEKSS